MPCLSTSALVPILTLSSLFPSCLPTSSTLIVRDFKAPDPFWSAAHRGIDILVEPEAPIYAMRSGVIRHVGKVVDSTWVSIDHGGKLISTYGPIAEPFLVHKNQRVYAGQQIGRLPEESFVLNVGVKYPSPTRKGKYNYLNPVTIFTPWQVTTRPVSP